MDFVPVFESAKRQGLKTTMHLLEVSLYTLSYESLKLHYMFKMPRNYLSLFSQVPGQYEETAELFQRFIPDRLGHAIYLHSSPSDFRNQVHDVAVQHRIPIGWLCGLLVVYETDRCKQFLNLVCCEMSALIQDLSCARVLQKSV